MFLLSTLTVTSLVCEQCPMKTKTAGFELVLSASQKKNGVSHLLFKWCFEFHMHKVLLHCRFYCI